MFIFVQLCIYFILQHSYSTTEKLQGGENINILLVAHIDRMPFSGDYDH